MAFRLAGIAGSFSRPSKTRSLVQAIGDMASERYRVKMETFDLEDIGPSLGTAKRRGDLSAQALRVIEAVTSADAVILGAPTYKGSYPGLFKHLVDLLEPGELRAKPVIIAATGGGERHALMVEHQMRPLLGFFMAYAMPTAIYASDRDFTDYIVSSEALYKRIAASVSELEIFLSTAQSIAGRGAA